MKLTPAQQAGLSYFKAIKENAPRRRRPDTRVINALTEKGLLHYVPTERFDYLLKCNVPDTVLEISPAGLNFLQPRT
jgi:hypothetical protein